MFRMGKCQVLIVVVALFNWLTVYSQSLGKGLTSLREDSSSTFNHPFLIAGTIDNIRNSDAIFELRYYRTPTRGRHYTSVLQLRYYDGHTEITSLQLRLMDGIYFVQEADSFIITKNYGLTELFSSPLCNLTDQKIVVDSIRGVWPISNFTNRNSDLKCADCTDHFFLVELKSGNKFRNFYLSDHADGYYRVNAELALLKPYADLLALIRKTFLPVSNARKL